MLKNILSTAKQLNKEEQNSINGGKMHASCADMYRGAMGCYGYVIPRCKDYCQLT